MNIDSSGEIGSQFIGHPIVVVEPSIGLSQCDPISTARVIEMEFIRGQDGIDPVYIQNQLSYLTAHRRFLDVDVGDLMIDNGEGLAITWREHLSEGTGTDGEQPILTEDAIDANRPPDGDEPIFRNDERNGSDVLRGIDDRSDTCIHFMNAVDVGCRLALKVIIEVGQIGQSQVRLVASQDESGGIRDPSGGRQTGIWTPKGREWKGAKMLDQIAIGVVNNVKDLRAIASIVRFRGCAPTYGRVLVKPPKHFGGLDPLVQQLSVDESIGLLPEADFGIVPLVPSVADNAMLVRLGSCQQGRLNRARDCRNWGLPGEIFSQFTNARCIGEQFGRQPYHIDDTNLVHVLRSKSSTEERSIG